MRIFCRFGWHMWIVRHVRERFVERCDWCGEFREIRINR